MCTAASKQLLGPIDKVSSGAVTVLSDTNGVKKIYIDASAGGTSGEATRPRIYVELAGGTKVSVTDVSATTSTDWDLALKRPIIFTNDGDGGPGMGGAVLVQKAFDAVTSADAAKLSTELFFDADCNPKTDQTGSVQTTMTSWYAYDQNTHGLSPAAGTWIVRGGTGTLYKLKFDTYYGTPQGAMGDPMTSIGGTFIIEVSAL
jgi:hypothetical protein